MATIAQQNGSSIDTVQQGGGALLTPLVGSDERKSLSVKESQEKLTVLQRKVLEKSILDDIMGDPEDFRALGDSDGESDGDQPNERMPKAPMDGEKETAHEDQLQLQGVTENSQRTSLGKDVAFCKTVVGDHHSSDRQFHKVDMESPCIHVEANDDRRTSVQARGTRFFIIKSLNHHNLEKSVKKGIWATQAMNEPILNKAFENAERVILIFSVNMSGHFQGYAQMMSSIGQRRAHVWNETNWGGTFNVEWIRLYDLPFQRTIHLKNPLNFFKPIKISRDCQELTEEIGEALCALIDEGANGENRSKRKFAHIGDGFSKKTCAERTLWVDCDHYGSARAMPMECPWTSMRNPYGLPTFTNDLYNLQVPVTMGGFSTQGSLPKSSSVDWCRFRQSKSFMSGSPREDIHDERGKRGQLEGKERTKGSPMVAIDFDDEFLNMSYEEYLWRVGNTDPPFQQGISIWSGVEENW